MRAKEVAEVIKIDIGCGFVLVRHMKNGELEYAEIYKESDNPDAKDAICIQDYYRCGDEDTLIVNFLLNHMECVLYALQHRDELEFIIDPLFRAGLFKKCDKEVEE